MRNQLNTLVAFAAGALAMYYLDARMGARRRALARDKLLAAGHDAADFLEAKGKRAVDRAKGVVATGRLDRLSSTEPESDLQLCERIRSRIGHLVRQPKAVEVEAEQGRVTLKGHLLTHEIDKVLAEVSAMTGVNKVDNALTGHGDPREITDWLNRRQAANEQQQTAPLL